MEFWEGYKRFRQNDPLFLILRIIPNKTPRIKDLRVKF